jgi:hypothetical protein
MSTSPKTRIDKLISMNDEIEINGQNTNTYNRINIKNEQNIKINGQLLLWQQIRLMTWKNIIVFRRNLKQTLFTILTPIVICLMLVFLQQLVIAYKSDYVSLNPENIELNSLTKCVNPHDCITVGIGIIVIYYINLILTLY